MKENLSVIVCDAKPVYLRVLYDAHIYLTVDSCMYIHHHQQLAGLVCMQQCKSFSAMDAN